MRLRRVCKADSAGLVEPPAKITYDLCILNLAESGRLTFIEERHNLTYARMKGATD